MQLDIDFRIVIIGIFALLAIVLFSTVNWHCSGDGGDSLGALDRVRSEYEAGKEIGRTSRREQLELDIRSMRVLSRKLLREGRKEESRRATAIVLDLERQLKDLDSH